MIAGETHRAGLYQLQFPVLFCVKYWLLETAAGQEGAKEASAEFLERQREEVARRVAEAHIVITTALIPGRPAGRIFAPVRLAQRRATSW